MLRQRARRTTAIGFSGSATIVFMRIIINRRRIEPLATETAFFRLRLYTFAAIGTKHFICHMLSVQFIGIIHYMCAIIIGIHNSLL